VFAADTEQTVRTVCERAGLPVNRMTPVSDARIAPERA
jgi:hypothetical protein